MALQFDRSLARTVLFSVAVVFFIVAVYQTIVQNDLGRNYWLYMISFGCVMWFRYLGLEKKPADGPVAPAPPKTPARRPAGQGKNKRKK